MNEKLNMETYTTAVESPFNDTVECHNLIVTEAMKKTFEDEKCEPKIALAGTVSTKIALQNHLGHSKFSLISFLHWKLQQPVRW